VKGELPKGRPVINADAGAGCVVRGRCSGADAGAGWVVDRGGAAGISVMAVTPVLDE
jgi:hypothetical protein